MTVHLVSGTSDASHVIDWKILKDAAAPRDHIADKYTAILQKI
jgi:hypothetical protein